MLLEWVVPAECPSEHEVVSHVRSLAGETTIAQPLHVWARIVRVEGAEGEPLRWRLELRIGSQSEAPRVLESNECRKLAEATAFIVALDLQSRADAEAERVVPPSPSPRAPLARPTNAKVAPALVAPKRARSGASSPPPYGGLGGDFVGDVGTLPSPAWAGSIFGYVGYGSFRGELSAALWPRNRASVSSPPGAGASISLRTVGLRACWTPLPMPWVDACLHVEGGVLHAAGFGIPRPSTPDGAWFNGLAGLTVRPLGEGPVRARATVELGVPLVYPTVIIDGIGQVYTPAPVVFRFAIGLETKLF